MAMKKSSAGKYLQGQKKYLRGRGEGEKALRPRRLYQRLVHVHNQDLESVQSGICLLEGTGCGHQAVGVVGEAARVAFGVNGDEGSQL